MSTPPNGQTAPPSPGESSGSPEIHGRPRHRKAKFLALTAEQLGIPEPEKGTIPDAEHLLSDEARVFAAVLVLDGLYGGACTATDLQIAKQAGFRGTKAARRRRVQIAFHGRTRKDPNLKKAKLEEELVIELSLQVSLASADPFDERGHWRLSEAKSEELRRSIAEVERRASKQSGPLHTPGMADPTRAWVTITTDLSAGSLRKIVPRRACREAILRRRLYDDGPVDDAFGRPDRRRLGTANRDAAKNDGAVPPAPATNKDNGSLPTATGAVPPPVIADAPAANPANGQLPTQSTIVVEEPSREVLAELLGERYADASRVERAERLKRLIEQGGQYTVALLPDNSVQARKRFPQAVGADQELLDLVLVYEPELRTLLVKESAVKESAGSERRNPTANASGAAPLISDQAVIRGMISKLPAGNRGDDSDCERFVERLYADPGFRHADKDPELTKKTLLGQAIDVKYGRLGVGILIEAFEAACKPIKRNRSSAFMDQVTRSIAASHSPGPSP